MYLIISYNRQDCVCLVAQYQYCPKTADQFNVKTDMDLRLSGEGLLWYARPQLFFHSTVAPVGQLEFKARHTELLLVFFSTFEPNKVTPNSVMQHNGVPMFFDSASSTNLPSLYIQRMCWDVCHQCLAIWAVVHTQPCPTASATGLGFCRIQRGERQRKQAV